MGVVYGGNHWEQGFGSYTPCKKLDMLTFTFKPKCPANLAKMESGKFIERPCIKKYSWSGRERHLDVNLWPLY